MARTKRQPGEPIIVKKYANRRLYNTDTSSYVTLDHLADMIKRDEEFVVRDAKTGEDITRSVLAQIIFEKESKDKTMLPLPFLRQLISLYGDGLQGMVPNYLESAMAALTKNQEQVRDAFMSGQGAKAFMPVFEEMTRQNMALMEQTMQLFTPPGGARTDADDGVAHSKNTLAEKEREVEQLKAEIADLQSKVSTLSNK